MFALDSYAMHFKNKLFAFKLFYKLSKLSCFDNSIIRGGDLNL